MSDGNGTAGKLVFGRTTAGKPVAECKLAAGETGLLAVLTEEASARGAASLWIHCPADLSSAGFTPQYGYRRLTAAVLSPSDPLPLLDAKTVRDLLPRTFAGQWGHHQADEATVEFFAGGPCAGLGEPGHWTGLCRFEPEERLIDGPGFTAGSASPEAARQLVLGAAAHLGAGPVTLETWGESPDAYLELGFTIAEENGGWELVLTP